MKVVLDTNVVISALIVKHSKAFEAYQKIISHHQVLSSIEVEIELIEKIKEKKFKKYFATESIRDELLFSFLSSCTLIQVIHKVELCRDPDDDKFLELALSGAVDLIISGDSDLTILNPFEGIPIIKPIEFLHRYQNE